MSVFLSSTRKPDRRAETERGKKEGDASIKRRAGKSPRKDVATSGPPAVLKYIRLPDKLDAGRYNVYGDSIASQQAGGDDPDKSKVSVVIELSPPAPIYHIWGILDEDLNPGQQAIVVFLNLLGDAPVAGAFTGWDRARNVPVLPDGLLTRISVQRAAGIVRIVGQNDSSRKVSAAAGIVVGTLAVMLDGAGAA